jgi:hypothetical protein
VSLPVTEVPTGDRNKATTLGMQYLQPPEMGAGSGPPDGASVVHQVANKLLAQQHSVPNGEFTPAIPSFGQFSG